MTKATVSTLAIGDGGAAARAGADLWPSPVSYGTWRRGSRPTAKCSSEVPDRLLAGAGRVSSPRQWHQGCLSGTEPAKDTTKLSARFPGELAEQIERYAARKSSFKYVLVDVTRAFITADKEFIEAWAIKRAHATKGAAPSTAQPHGQSQGATDAPARASAAPAA